MNLKDKILVWIFLLVFLSAMGRFIDYLLNTNLRKDEKNSIRVFFAKILKTIDKTNFRKLQLLVIKYFLDFGKLLIGKKFALFRYLLLLLRQITNLVL